MTCSLPLAHLEGVLNLLQQLWGNVIPEGKGGRGRCNNTPAGCCPSALPSLYYTACSVCLLLDAPHPRHILTSAAGSWRIPGGCTRQAWYQTAAHAQPCPSMRAPGRRPRPWNQRPNTVQRLAVAFKPTSKRLGGGGGEGSDLGVGAALLTLRQGCLRFAPSMGPPPRPPFHICQFPA